MNRDQREVRIGLIRHYWQDGENAAWHSDPSLPDEVVNSIKKDYALLIASRPARRTYGRWTVLLRYEDENDRFGRSAAAITAAALPHPDDPALEAEVQTQLGECPRSTLSIVARNLPPRQAAQKSPREHTYDGPRPLLESVSPALQRRKRGAIIAIAIAAVLIAGTALTVSYMLMSAQPAGIASPQTAGTAADGSIMTPGTAAPEGDVAQFCREEWPNVLRAMKQGGVEAASCIAIDAARVCQPDAQTHTPSFAQRVEEFDVGYCALFRDMPADRRASSALNELAALADGQGLARLSAVKWASALLGLQAEASMSPSDAAPWPQGEHRRVAVTQRGGGLDPLAFIQQGKRQQFLSMWNESLPAGLAEVHELPANAEPIATGRSYLEKYCRTVESLARAKDRALKSGVTDPLLESVLERTSKEEIDPTSMSEACARGDNGNADLPARMRAITDSRSDREAVTRLVTVVDFCSLVPELTTLRRHRVSPAVQSCKDVARVLGLAW